MPWKIFFCLFSALLSCSGIPNPNQGQIIKFNYTSLNYWTFLPASDLRLSESDMEEFVQSTLDAADKGLLKLEQEREAVTFSDALIYFAAEMQPLRKEFLPFFNLFEPNTVNTDKFHTAEEYLYSLFDLHSIYDFQKAVIDFANGMNTLVHECNELTPEQKSEFAKKTADFLSSHPPSNPNLTDRFYLSPQTMTCLLGLRLAKTLEQTSEPFKKEIEVKIFATDDNFFDLIAIEIRLSSILEHFLDIFHTRVQITDIYEKFTAEDFEGFKDSSDGTILSWYINQMLGIVAYCESKGYKFDAVKVKEWKKTFPKNFIPQPLNFSAPKPKGLSFWIKILIVLGILALLSAAIIGFILYKRNKNREVSI